MEVKDNILIDGKNVFKATNSTGLSFTIFDNGVIENITCRQTQINLISASPLGNSCCNLYLRKRSDSFSAVAMIAHLPRQGISLTKTLTKQKANLKVCCSGADCCFARVRANGSGLCS